MLSISAGIIAILMPVGLAAQSITSSKAQAIDSLITKVIGDAPIAGVAITVMQGDDLIFSKGYGWADRDRKVAARPETVYRIGSISKTLAAAAVLRLAQLGEIRLDDSVGHYVPEVRGRIASITIRQLLTHTSGLGRRIPSFATAARKLDDSSGNLLRQIQAIPVEFSPAADWSYSNGGYALLGIIIERLTGKAYRDLLSEHITGPLDFQFAPRPSGGESLLALPYFETQGKLVSGKFGAPIDFASGGIWASALDLATWQGWLNNGHVLASQWLDTMRQPVKLSDGTILDYGCGLRMGELAGHRKLGHTGWWGDYTSVLSYYPDDSLTIAVLCNTAYLKPHALHIESAVAQFLLGVPASLPRQGIPKEELAEYVGGYVSSSGTCELFLRDGRLYMREGKSAAHRLEYVGGGLFEDAADSDWTYRLTRTGKNRWLHQYRCGMFWNICHAKKIPASGTRRGSGKLTR